MRLISNVSKHHVHLNLSFIIFSWKPYFLHISPIHALSDFDVLILIAAHQDWYFLSLAQSSKKKVSEQSFIFPPNRAKRTIMICTESNHQRISFAGDLGQSDKGPPMEQQPSGPVRRDTTLLDSSNSDFEFHISRNFDPEDSSPADEIFADGMILPVLPFQVTAGSTMPKRLYKYELPPIVSAPSLSSYLPPLPLPLPGHSIKYSVKETRGSVNGRGSGANSDSEAEKSSKSFWSFKRSSSLNCDIKKSLICSFPRLTRSNSTGSVMNSKREMLRDINKHSSQRHGVPRPGVNQSSHMRPPSSLCCSSYQFRPQKHAGKNGGGRGGSFWIAPVIGGPSPFGLGSILRLTKEKKKK